MKAPIDAAMGYVRVSTGKQEISPEAQRARIESYCSLRGLRLIDVISDIDVSGAIPLHKRPGGRELMDAVEDREIAHVIAVKLDRLFRDVPNCLEVVEGWDKRNVALHLVDLGGNHVDTSSALGRFMLVVFAAVAEMERGMISERTIAALKHKKDQGECIGTPPYGQRRVGETGIEDDPAEQGVLSLIRTLREQRMSYRRICEQLNSLGIPARGERWHHFTLVRLNKRGLLPAKPARKRRRKARPADGYDGSGPGSETQPEPKETASLGIESGESNARIPVDVGEAA